MEEGDASLLEQEPLLRAGEVDYPDSLAARDQLLAITTAHKLYIHDLTARREVAIDVRAETDAFPLSAAPAFGTTIPFCASREDGSGRAAGRRFRSAAWSPPLSPDLGPLLVALQSNHRVTLYDKHGKVLYISISSSLQVVTCVDQQLAQHLALQRRRKKSPPQRPYGPTRKRPHASYELDLDEMAITSGRGAMLTILRVDVTFAVGGGETISAPVVATQLVHDNPFPITALAWTTVGGGLTLLAGASNGEVAAFEFNAEALHTDGLPRLDLAARHTVAPADGIAVSMLDVHPTRPELVAAAKSQLVAVMELRFGSSPYGVCVRAHSRPMRTLRWLRAGREAVRAAGSLDFDSSDAAVLATGAEDGAAFWGYDAGTLRKLSTIPITVPILGLEASPNDLILLYHIRDPTSNPGGPTRTLVAYGPHPVGNLANGVRYLVEEASGPLVDWDLQTCVIHLPPAQCRQLFEYLVRVYAADPNDPEHALSNTIHRAEAVLFTLGVLLSERGPEYATMVAETLGADYVDRLQRRGMARHIARSLHALLRRVAASRDGSGVRVALPPADTESVVGMLLWVQNFSSPALVGNALDNQLRMLGGVVTSEVAIPALSDVSLACAYCGVRERAWAMRCPAGHPLQYCILTMRLLGTRGGGSACTFCAAGALTLARDYDWVRDASGGCCARCCHAIEPVDLA